jgi:DNA-binding NarL/FixJ family response regulator
MPKLSVIIAEESYLIKKGLISLLLEFPSIGKVSESANEESLLECLEKESYTICFINPSILTSKGIQRIHELTGKKSGIMVAILTSESSEKAQLKLFAECISLNQEKSQLVMIMDRLFTRFDKSRPDFENSSGLSKREKIILRHIALGYTNKEIGEKLFISTHTVVTHRKNITRKIGIKTVSGLTVYAIFNKIVGMDEIRTSG